MTDGILSAAVFWLEQGVALAPVQPRSKKLVAGFGAYGQRIIGVDGARAWFGDRHCNLALICGTGPGAGLVAIDFDDRTAYEAWRLEHPDLASTRTDLTRRGAHVYLWGPVDRAAVPGVEVIHRGVIVAAPSVHPSGAVYRTLDPGALVLPAPASWSSDSRTDAALPLLSKSPSARVAPQTASGDLLTQLKAAFSVLDLAQTLTKLHTRDERWFHGCCPWHQDREPSFWVDVERGTWGCYACKAAGDVVNLWALARGISTKAAISELARRLRDGGSWP